jgi:hypothetical protein
VNTSALALSTIAAAAKDYIGVFSIDNLNFAGALIMVISFAAFISTIGYWRYYELCDIYAKEFRDFYISETILKEVRKNVEWTFHTRHRWLSQRWLENAHHAMWLGIQGVVFVIGLAILLRGGGKQAAMSVLLEFHF